MDDIEEIINKELDEKSIEKEPTITSEIHDTQAPSDIEKPKKLYHIITDTGEFTIDSIKIKDYNSAIEDILDMRDKLFDLF